MFETYPINYDLNGGSFKSYKSKEELRVCFMSAFYDFVSFYEPDLPNIISLSDFLLLKPFEVAKVKIGDGIIARYFLEDTLAMNLQSGKSFVGYCLIQGLFAEVIGHLIAFFYRWRDLEEVNGMQKDLSIDFFFNSWAALVDSCKYFLYNDGNDIVKYGDSGLCARDVTILKLLNYYPIDTVAVPYKTNRHVDVILPIPELPGKVFKGWHDGKCYLKDIKKETSAGTNLVAIWE